MFTFAIKVTRRVKAALRTASPFLPRIHSARSCGCAPAWQTLPRVCLVSTSLPNNLISFTKSFKIFKSTESNKIGKPRREKGTSNLVQGSLFCYCLCLNIPPLLAGGRSGTAVCREKEGRSGMKCLRRIGEYYPEQLNRDNKKVQMQETKSRAKRYTDEYCNGGWGYLRR